MTGPEMMLNKNLRHVLYYVVTVSLLCLMIEVTKRIPDPRTSLSPKYYEVVTANQAELQSPPKASENEEAVDVIPRRNRGRLPLKETANEDVEPVIDEKAKFREWKIKQNIKSDEKGLFKRWKKEMRFGQSGVGEEEILENKKIRNIESNSEDEDDQDEEEEEEEEEEQEEKVKKKPSVMSDEPEGYDDSLSIADNTIDTEDLIDYPEGISRYISAAENSCSDFALTQTFRERRKQVRDTCQKLKVQQRILYSRMRWAVPERLLYCPVFKAASTSWLMNYFQLSNSTSSPKEGNLHTKITNLFPPPATFKLRKQIYSESVKFIIVRHPFERLVSAYRDKLAGFTRNDHYLQMRKVIIKNYRTDKSDRSSIPSFK